MNQKEVWKDIPNYRGYYQVSNLGRVKSLNRKVKHSTNSKLVHLRKERLLTQNKSTGYYRCLLSVNNERKMFLVHQLVAMAFLNHKPNGRKIIVDHIDNNSLNNNLSNLQIITHRENGSKDRINKSSKYTGVRKYKNSKKWYSEITINKKRKYLGSFDSEIEASNAYQKELNKLKKYGSNN